MLKIKVGTALTLNVTIHWLVAKPKCRERLRVLGNYNLRRPVQSSTVFEFTYYQVGLFLIKRYNNI